MSTTTGLFIRSALFATPLVALLVGCASPLPVVRLTPHGGNVTWVSGRAVVAQEKDGVEVAAAFDHQDGQTLAIRVEVMNGSAERLDVSPDRISFVTCAASTVCTPARWVIDPEATLMALDQRRSKEEADAINDELLGASLMLLSVTADVASVAAGKPRSATETTSLSASMSADEAQHHTALLGIEGQRAKWMTAALRRTTLLPGRSLAGYVFVPVDERARYVWIQVQAGERRFPFGFQQTTIPVGAGGRQRSHDASGLNARAD